MNDDDKLGDISGWTAFIHASIVRRYGKGSLYHPYECSHNEDCFHCSRTVTEEHDPYKCILCNGEDEPDDEEDWR